VILAQRAAAVAGALGALAIGLVPYRESFSNPGLASLVVGAVVVLVFGAGLEAIERWLVRRPQPFTDPPLVAADDAIRAQSIHALAGAGLALQLLFCCGVALGLQASDVHALQVTMVIPAAVCLVLSVYACVNVGERPWRVRRPAAAGGAATT
jgi:MFS-type transporter involved in bile tolerance (Atg22 family)